MRPLLLLVSMTFALTGCSPGDDGDAVITVAEKEPNGDSASATWMGAGGFYSFYGICQDGDLSDWFELTSKDGRVHGDLWASTTLPGTVEEFAGDPSVQLEVLSSTLAKLDELIVESDTKRSFSADVAAGAVYLRIACPGDEAMAFQGTLHVP